MNVATVSDSHVPDRASGIPEEFRERMGAADRMIHAGVRVLNPGTVTGADPGPWTTMMTSRWRVATWT